MLATEAQRWRLLPGDGSVTQAGVPGNGSVEQREVLCALDFFPFSEQHFSPPFGLRVLGQLSCNTASKGSKKKKRLPPR